MNSCKFLTLSLVLFVFIFPVSVKADIGADEN